MEEGLVNKPDRDAVVGSEAANASEPTRPRVPANLRETGVSPETVAALTLKMLYLSGARTGRDLAHAIRLPFEILDAVVFDLQHRHLIEISSVRGHSRGGYVFDLTGSGRSRAQELFQSSHYVGPAPVPVDVYHEWVKRQSVVNETLEPQQIKEGLSHLVLGSDILSQLGPAINSGRSMFLYGHAGNGKTEIAQSIARMMTGKIYVPYAVEIEGRIVVIEREEASDGGDIKEEGQGWMAEEPEFDPRFAYIDRPVVFTGGELSIEQLDLRYDPHAKFYRAPLQMQANGGVLIIDDLGRQLVRPDELLNRWMVPLERRIDYLTLHTGHSFPVPFDCLLIFSTNLEPSDLVDEAFLRRIHYKINMRSPSKEEYEEIFRLCCEKKGIVYRPGSVDMIYGEFYERAGIPIRACHPRDIVLHLCDIARYESGEPTLDGSMLEDACNSYFLT